MIKQEANRLKRERTMRDYLFRGKRIDNGEWVEGCGIIATENWVSIFTAIDDIDENSSEVNEIEVLPETVGQYTGLKDKNGTRIFEGDIVKSCEHNDVYFVKYFDSDNYSAFDCVPDVPLCECNGLSYLVNEEGCKVIGNIHDNPEILKGGDGGCMN